MTSPQVKVCAVCAKVLCKKNTSGLCAPHQNASRAPGRDVADDVIRAALMDGKVVREVVADLGVSTTRVRSLACQLVSVPTRRLSDIMVAAAAHAQITVRELIGECRKHSLVQVRQAIYLIATEHGHSSTRVGMSVGRDHTTVLAGRTVAEERIARCPAYADYIARVRSGAMPEAPDTSGSGQCVEEDPSPSPSPRAEAASSNPTTMARPKLQLKYRTAIPAAPVFRMAKRYERPKNDFRALAREDEDDAHRFHRDIAAGSRMLHAAILAVRPHGYQ